LQKCQCRARVAYHNSQYSHSPFILLFLYLLITVTETVTGDEQARLGAAAGSDNNTKGMGWGLQSYLKEAFH
jgi:hypothetical protein